MKKVILLVAVAAMALTSCKKGEIAPAVANTPGTESVNNAEPVRTIPADGKYPTMSFEKTEHDFGTIKAGDVVDYTFKFTNTGEADLLISSAKGTCGCTVPEFPKDPIKPGETGNLKVSFNSAGKKGVQKKTVNIVTNTESGKENLNISVSIEEAVK